MVRGLAAVCLLCVVVCVNADTLLLSRETREEHRLPPYLYGPDAYANNFNNEWNMDNHRPLALVDKVILGAVCGLLGVGAIGATAFYFVKKNKDSSPQPRA